MAIYGEKKEDHAQDIDLCGLLYWQGSNYEIRCHQIEQSVWRD
jgi:hypothetical protein